MDQFHGNSVMGGSAYTQQRPVSGKFYWELTLSALLRKLFGISKTDKLTHSLAGVLVIWLFITTRQKNGGGMAGAMDLVLGMLLVWLMVQKIVFKERNHQGDAFTGKD